MKTIIILFSIVVLFSACTKEDDVQPVQVIPEEMKGSAGPTVTTVAATLVTSRTATTGGLIANNGSSSSITAKGVCYSTSPNPTTANATVSAGSGSSSFACILSGLAGSTQYYVRAYAVKSGSTYYGNEITFTTLADYGPVTDADGNVYPTITIGTQVWMLENLKTTKYSDGTPIPNVPADADWMVQTSGAWCDYNNDGANGSTYGHLYNWYAVNDAHHLAPTGFHVPSYAEWDVLRNCLGGSNIAGGKAKEAGLVHWQSPNTGADNSSGFTALPGGARYYAVNTSGQPFAFFGHLTQNGVWWTSTATSSTDSWFIETNYNDILMYRSGFLGGIGYYDQRTGYSVRCVKD